MCAGLQCFKSSDAVILNLFIEVKNELHTSRPIFKQKKKYKFAKNIFRPWD